jgi:acyl-homoserine-lactone acylase
MQYEFDGEMRDFTTETVTVDVDTGSGIEQREHMFYFSHHGPIVDLGSLFPPMGGWPNDFGTVVALRDLVAENPSGPDQWIKMGQTTNIEEYKTALRGNVANVYNFVAADRHGTAFYGDISTIPHVTDAKAAHCIQGVIAETFRARGFYLLSSNTSD